MEKFDLERIKKLIPEVSKSLIEEYLEQCVSYIEQLEKEKKDMRYDFNSTLENFWTTSECYLSGMKAWPSDFPTRGWIKNMIARYKFN